MRRVYSLVNIYPIGNNSELWLPFRNTSSDHSSSSILSHGMPSIKMSGHSQICTAIRPSHNLNGHTYHTCPAFPTLDFHMSGLLKDLLLERHYGKSTLEPDPTQQNSLGSLEVKLDSFIVDGSGCSEPDQTGLLSPNNCRLSGITKQICF
jgi:hypothetical protein